MRKVKEYIPKVSHKDFQQMIKEAAEYNGWKVQFWWRSFHSPSGFPDLILCKPPRLIFAEIKVPPDKVKPAQQEWLDVLAKLPFAEIFIWYPADWDAITDVLSR